MSKEDVKKASFWTPIDVDKALFEMITEGSVREEKIRAGTQQARLVGVETGTPSQEL